MAAPAQTSRKDICPRCRVGVPLTAKRCQACSEPLSQAHKWPIYLGMAGVVTLMFIVFLFAVLIRHEDEAAKPALDPDTAPVTAPASSTPDRPPPLNK